jgi:hypothetical protein
VGRRAPEIRYATQFRIFRGGGEPGIPTLDADDASLALLSHRLVDMPGGSSRQPACEACCTRRRSSKIASC